MRKGLLPIVVLATLGIAAGSLTACAEPGESTSSVSYPAITKLTISNADELKSEWHVGEANRTVSLTTEPELNITTALQNGSLKITSSNKEVINVVGKVLYAVKEGTATITATYDGKVSASVEITVLPKKAALSIKDVIEGLNKGTIKKGSVVSTYGEITSTMLQVNGQIHNGVYLQDGDYALPLYAGKISENYFNGKNKVLDIGDQIYIEGKVDIYNGFRQVKPDVMRKFTTEDKFTVADPTMLTLTADNYNEDFLKSQMGRLVKFENLEYVSGGIADAGSRDDIMFKSGTVDVKVSYNYHVGEEAGAALKAKTDTLAPTNKVDVIGSIYWFNGPAIQPVFYKDGETLKTPADCFNVHPQPTVTGLTISGEKVVKATETIQLTVAATPEGASPAVTWTSSDTTIAKVSDSGEVLGVKPGKVTITATSKTVTTVKAEYAIDVKPAPIKNGIVLLEQAATGVFKLGTFDGRDGVKKNVYLTGEIKDNAFVTTPNYAEAANATVTAVEGGYTLQINNKFIGGIEKEFTNSKGEKYNKSVPQYQDEAFVWTWNETFNTFSYKHGEGDAAMEFVLSMKNNLAADKSIVELNKVNSFTAVNFNIKLVDYACSPVEVDMTKAPVGTFYAGYTKKDGTQLYLTGKMADYDFGMTPNFYDAAEVTIAEVEGGYTIKVGDSYMAFKTFVSKGKTKAGVEYVAEPYVLGFKETVFFKSLEVGDKGSEAPKDHTFGIWYDASVMKASNNISRESTDALTVYTIPAAETRPAASAIVVSGENKVKTAEFINLNADVYPSGANQNVTWESKNTDIATVGANGKVTGVKAGTATIVAKQGTVSTEFVVTVEVNELTSIDITTGTFDGLGSYGNYEGNASGVAITARNIMKGQNNSLQMNNKGDAGKESAVYNTSATPKAIKSITITWAEGKTPKAVEIYFGNESQENVTTGAVTTGTDATLNTVTIEVPEAQAGATFFKVLDVKGDANYIAQITVNF